MQTPSAIAYAVGTLTSSGTATDTQTVTVGGKVYTFQTTLTNVDGNVLIGANAAASLANLKAAINLAAGAGTTYATAMTANNHVKATTLTATTLKVQSLVPGLIGNLIASTETLTNFAWGGSVLASGTGSVATRISEMIAAGQLAADVMEALSDMDSSMDVE
jgi:hypothetical protein